MRCPWPRVFFYYFYRKMVLFKHGLQFSSPAAGIQEASLYFMRLAKNSWFFMMSAFFLISSFWSITPSSLAELPCGAPGAGMVPDLGWVEDRVCTVPVHGYC